MSLFLWIQAGARKNQVVGIHGDRLKLKIAAPAIEGAANKEVKAYLSKLFQKTKSDIIIVSGELSKHKRVDIDDLCVHEVIRQLGL